MDPTVPRLGRRRALPGARRLVPYALALIGLAAAACEDGAEAEQRMIRGQDAPRVREILDEDLARHRVGVVEAAKRLAPGFVIGDPAERIAQLRVGLRAMRQPPRGVEQLIASPMSFLAAVGADGKVIARGADPDTLQGKDFGKRYPVVAAALDTGEAAVGLGEFEPIEGEGPSSWSILFVAPAERDGERVGAVVAGIPLWRLAQRLSTQLRLETTDQQNTILWVFTTKGDRLFQPQSGIEIAADLPDGPARAKGLAEHPDGYLGKVKSYGRTYGFGVFEAPQLPGEDTGFVIVRSNPD